MRNDVQWAIYFLSVAAVMPYWMYPHLDETQLALKEKAKGDWKELSDVSTNYITKALQTEHVDF